MNDDLNIEGVEKELGILDPTPPNQNSFSAMTGIQQMTKDTLTPKMPMPGIEPTLT